MHNRGSKSKSDGGLANNEEFKSYAISLGGKDFYSLDNSLAEGFSYKLGYAKQAAGTGNEKAETRFVASLAYKQDLTKDLSTRVFVERMAIDHLSGESAHDRIHTTVGFSFDYKGWNLGGTHTDINNEAGEEDENHDGYSPRNTFKNSINIS